MLGYYLGIRLVFKKLLDVFPTCHTILCDHQKCMSSSYFMFSPTFGGVSLFNFGYSPGCIIVSHCGFCTSLMTYDVEDFSCAY